MYGKRSKHDEIYQYAKIIVEHAVFVCRARTMDCALHFWQIENENNIQNKYDVHVDCAVQGAMTMTKSFCT